MENFLNFCANCFMNFSKISKVFDEYIFAEYLPESNFWRRHCSTGLEWNSYMKLCPMFHPEPKSRSRYWYERYFCTAYYTKITLLNNLKLTVLLLIVNVHITEIVSRASRSLICISIGLQLHTVTQCTSTCVRVISRTAQCSSQHILYSLISLH